MPSRPSILTAAGVVTKNRVHYSGVTRIATYKAECPGCGTWVQGPVKSRVEALMAAHLKDCPEAKAVIDGKVEGRTSLRKARKRATIDIYVPPAQREAVAVGGGAD